MGPVVNLNRFRKAKQRAEEQRRAAENRAIFGRSKKDREADAKDRRRSDHDLDGKKLD
jgi:hypothetical protein